MDDAAPFDPMIAPRPCSISNCKNHVPGNSIYKRCKHHRQGNRVYYSTTQEKRERQKEIYRKAKEEGRDPEEALREFLLQSGDQSGDDSEGEGEDTLEGKRKRKRPSGDPSTIEGVPDSTTAGLSCTRKRSDPVICSGKNCMNLLNPHVRRNFPPFCNIDLNTWCRSKAGYVTSAERLARQALVAMNRRSMMRLRMWEHRHQALLVECHRYRVVHPAKRAIILLPPILL